MKMISRKAIKEGAKHAKFYGHSMDFAFFALNLAVFA